MIKKKKGKPGAPGTRATSPTNTGGKTVTRTMVDMGDDLLFGTATLIRPDLPPPSVDVQFENAQILVNEGLLDDAKKTLRKILLQDPGHAGAKRALQQLLDNELKKLLTDESTDLRRRPVPIGKKGRRGRTSEPSTDELLKSMDQEFGLGIFEASPESADIPREHAEGANAPSVKDHIDLGVAFLEMGAHAEASEQFRLAIDLLAEQPALDRPLMVSASSLLALSLLRSEKAFEAMQVIHPVLRDPYVQTEEKTEFFYLMGWAHELTKGRKAALPWYFKVYELDPHYRNISEKLRKPK